MLGQVQVREIGGDFEAVSPELLTAGPATPPWEARHRDAATTYLETGRQALAAVEVVLRQEGRSRLIVPAFFCDSMVLPFVRRGWKIVPVQVGSDLFPVPSAIRSVVENPGTAAVLHAPSFGQDTPGQLVDELADARRAGARILVDETHRPFSPSAVTADFYVASLRKTLPLLDGAYVAGDRVAAVGSTRTDATGVSRLRALAMEAKSRHLDGARRSAVHLDLFRQADELVADRLVGHAMSGASEALLRRLDYAEIARRRRANACALAADLIELGAQLLLDPRDSSVIPSHLVIVVPEPRTLQAALAARGIYCPVHWHRPTLVEVREWPERLLSIPVDQRYRLSDMSRVAEAIGDVWATQYSTSNAKTV